jgi:hypothetical protein
MKRLLIGFLALTSVSAFAAIELNLVSEVETKLSKAIYQKSVSELRLDEDVYEQAGTRDMARLAREVKRAFGCVNTTYLTNEVGGMKARQVRDMILSNCYNIKTPEFTLEKTVEVVSDFTPLTTKQFFKHNLLDRQILNNYVSGAMYGNLNHELKNKFGDCAHGAIWERESISIRELSSVIYLQCNF